MNEDAMLAAIASAEAKLEKLDAKKKELEDAIELKKAQITNLEDAIALLGEVEEQAAD
jgi:prefoldin subunit 5